MNLFHPCKTNYGRMQLCSRQYKLAQCNQHRDLCIHKNYVVISIDVDIIGVIIISPLHRVKCNVVILLSLALQLQITCEPNRLSIDNRSILFVINLAAQSLTHKAPKWIFLRLTSKSKIRQFGLLFLQINNNVLGLDVTMQDTLFFALYGGLENLRKEAPTFILSHPVTGVDDIEQVRGYFGAFEHEHEVFSVGENVK